MTTSPFLAAGFSAAVTGSSATPATDGYVGTFGGHPYHIHPTATPEQWALLQDAIAANVVTVTAWTAPVVTTEQAMANLRVARDLLLAQSDWTQLPRAPLTTEEQEAWATYRQALRNLPEANASDPGAAVFPTAPA